MTGSLVLAGLEGPVEILWDSWGVPTIQASCLLDAVFAQGVVHARDRFWQMELNRRVSAGRLSEMLGPRTVAADRFMRRIGVRRAAAQDWSQVTSSEKHLLEAYAAGVNSLLTHPRWRRPLELVVLGVRPEPWTPIDSLSWAKMLAFDLGSSWESELLRSRLLESLGPDLAALFHLSYPQGQPYTTPSGDRSLLQDLQELYGQARPWMGGGGASNAWVVAGSRTSTGKPLLASDPHLILRLPSTWYEVQLQAPQLDVFGVSLPGLPLVLLGRNPHLAWGATNSFADCQDLFIQEFREGRYRWKGEEVQPERLREVIRVRYNSPVLEEVVVTRQGPVMAGDTRRGTALTLAWTGYTPEHLVSTLLAMNQAGSAAEFRRALKDWSTPSLNFVYADDQGDIGYMMAGRVPRRPEGSGGGLVPQGGGGELEWLGWIDPESLPAEQNPSTGYLVTANNAVGPTPYHLSWDFMSGYRAQRIEQRLAAERPWQPADFGRLQTDLLCLSGLEFVEECKQLRLAPGDPLDQQALSCLLAWDGQAHPESRGAAVYEVMLLETFQQAYVPWLGEELVGQLLGKSESPLVLMAPHGGRYVALLLQHLRAREGAALGLEPGPNPQAWREVLERALSRTTARLRWLLGERSATWRWGRLHRVRLRHVLGGIWPLRRLLNGPEAPLGGDTDTILQTAVVPHQPYGVECWAPSWRFVADLSHPMKAWSVLPSGQSGSWRNRHYLDQFRLWCRGDLRPRSRGEARLNLLPDRA